MSSTCSKTEKLQNTYTGKGFGEFTFRTFPKAQKPLRSMLNSNTSFSFVLKANTFSLSDDRLVSSDGRHGTFKASDIKTDKVDYWPP